MKGKFSLPNILTAVTLFIYVVGLIWWFWLYTTGAINSLPNYLFSIPMSLPPLTVGVLLIVSSLRKSWNFSLRRYQLYFGLYLCLWGIATAGTVYYNLLAKVEAPYPSLLDFCYVSSQISLLVAVIAYISKIRKWHYVKDVGQKIIFFGAAPIIQLTLYWAVMQFLNREPFPDLNLQYVSSMSSLILNIIIFIVLYIFAFIIFFRKIEKIDAKLSLYLIGGMTMQYITDYYFIFLLTRNEFYIGHFVDLMFLTVYVCMSLVGVRIVTDEHNVL